MQPSVLSCRPAGWWLGGQKTRLMRSGCFSFEVPHKPTDRGGDGLSLAGLCLEGQGATPTAACCCLHMAGFMHLRSKRTRGHDTNIPHGDGRPRTNATGRTLTLGYGAKSMLRQEESHRHHQQSMRYWYTKCDRTRQKRSTSSMGWSPNNTSSYVLL